MSSRLRACLTCTGKTRHRAVCASCRRRGVIVKADKIIVPIDLHLSPTVTMLPATREKAGEAG